MDGDDFARPTIELLAKRAGYVCSNPSCQANTVGPSKARPDKSTSVGVAAHIMASRAGGARYDSSLTSDQRKNAENGIWLCQTCSRLIDTNGGADHSMPLLRKWKSEHEAKMAENLGTAARPAYTELAGNIEARGIGTVIGADIRKPTRIQPGTHVSASGLGKITGVRIGGNDD